MKTKMKRKYTAVEKRENRQLYLLMLPVFILIAVFCYAPMFGIVIAFQDYWPGDPFFGDGAMWVDWITLSVLFKVSILVD